MYAHDHCFDFIVPLENYPEGTIYKMNNCRSFSEWVEGMAVQWLNHIKK